MATKIGGGDLGNLLGSFGGGGGGFNMDKLFDTIGDIRKKNRPPAPSAPYGGHLTQGPYWEQAPNWYRGSGGSAVGPGFAYGKAPEAAVHQNQYRQYGLDVKWNQEKYGWGKARNPNARGIPGAIAPDWYVYSPDTQQAQVSAGWWNNPFGTGSPDAAAKTNRLAQEQRMRDWQGMNRQKPSIEQIQHAQATGIQRHYPYTQKQLNIINNRGRPQSRGPSMKDIKKLIGGIFGNGKDGGGGRFGGKGDELFGFTGGGIPNPLYGVVDQGKFGTDFGGSAGTYVMGMPQTNIKSGPAPQWAIDKSGKNILRTSGIANDPIASAAMAASGAQAANQFTRDYTQQNAQFGLSRDKAVANQGLALMKYMLERKAADQAITTGERQAILRLIQSIGLG